jgi:hypothetical protein
MTPLGWFNVSLSYLDAADTLACSDIKLGFDAPIRALYAQTWELALKACLLRQGRTIKDVRSRDFGHDIVKIFDAVDRIRFGPLNLSDNSRMLVEHMAQYHLLREYNYPLTGPQRHVSLTYLRRNSERFRVSRGQIMSMFGSP